MMSLPSTPRLNALDDVVLSQLAPRRSPPPPAARDDDRLVTIELITPEELAECPATTKFDKFYDQLEIEPLVGAVGTPATGVPLQRSRPQTFVKTVRVSRELATPWFDLAFDAPAEEELTGESWWWLAISVGAGALATLAMYLFL